MDDQIINASGADDLNRLTAAVLKLDAALAGMGARDTALTSLTTQMEKMVQTISTSLTEILAVQEKSNRKWEESAKAANARKLAEEERAWEKLIFTSNKANSQLEAQQDAANARKLEKAAAVQMKQLEQEISAENKRAAALQAYYNRSAALSEEAGAKSWQNMLDIEAKKTASLAAELAKRRALEEASAAASWKSMLEIEAKKAANLESQRQLNTRFLSSNLGSQINTAEQAALYASMGGNAAQRYGSAAATADIAALRQQYAQLPAAIRNSQNAMAAHNEAMRDGHALARGLAGSLGGLWLTYGNLVPLAAGAALASSLKGVYSAGKEVEYQLKFVEALAGEAPNLDKFLSITGQTVVSIKDAAEGMRALSQNGLSARDSLKVLPDVLNLAVIGEMNVSAAALSATGVVSAFGLALSDIGRASDIFAQAAASSNTSVSAMTEAMKQASTVATVYNVSIEEVAAAQGTLAKVNITGSAAGTAYTNVLNGLYAPTRQAAKALAELGVTTSENDGSLKNSTKLLGELRTALGRYNDAAQATFYNDIFTARGAKGASVILDNWDEYIAKIEEAKNATGFAGEAVAKLEDSVEGASKRLQNSFGATLVKAFEPVAPALQSLILHLAEIAGSDGAVKTLTNLAEIVLEMTKFLVDNASALGTMIALYAGVSSLTSIWTALSAGMRAYQVSTAAAATTTAVMAAEVRLLTAALGPIALAITAATVAWQVFGSDTVPAVESADQKLRNSIQANIDYLERETAALNERNAARNGPTAGPQGDDASKLIGSLQAQYDAIKQQYDAAGGDRSGRPKNLDPLYQSLIAKEKELNDARAKGFEQMSANAALTMGKMAEADQNEKDKLESQIQGLVNKGRVEKTLAGEVVAIDERGNAASRAFAASQQTLLDNVRSGVIDTKQGFIELTAAQRQYSSLLEGRAPAQDKKAENDAFRAAMQEQKNIRQANADALKSQLSDIDSLQRRNEISSLERYARERDAKNASLVQNQETFAQEERLAKTKENSLTIERKIAGAAAQSLRAAAENDKAYERQVADTAKAAQDQATQYQAGELKKRGDMAAAFVLTNENRYEAMNLNIASSQEMLAKALESGDEAAVSRARNLLGTFMAQAEAYKGELRQITNDEAFQKALKAANLGLTTLQTEISRLGSASDSSSGLAAIFNNAYLSASKFEAALPGLQAQYQKLRETAALTGDPKDLQTADAFGAQLRAQAEQMRSIWISVGQTITESLTGAFGKSGTALGKMLEATLAYSAKQKQIQQDVEAAKETQDPIQVIAAQKKAALDSSSAQLRSFGALTDGAKNFFGEQTKGYKALQAASQVFHAAELAMTIAELVPKGISAILTQGEGDPYSAFARIAAMTAIVAALGVAVGGGGAPPSAAAMQTANGTGRNADGTRNSSAGVFGDADAKSDSIAKSLTRVQDSTYRQLNYSANMLNALRNIENNIAGLANLVVRTAGITGETTASTGYSGLANLSANPTFNLVFGGAFGMLNNALNKLTGGASSKITNAIFGGKTSVNDAGLQINSGSLGSILQNGVSASQYQVIKRDGGLFRSTKYSTQTTELGSDITNQFGLIIRGMADSITQAADVLGLGGDDFTKKLNSFVVDIGKISLKDLTGEEIQKALETAFSKLGDDMANYAVSGLQQFAQVGEGSLETLVRIATDYQAVDAVMASMGKTFGAVGFASVAARERLIEMAGGLDEFKEQSNTYVEAFYSEAERLEFLSKAVGTQMEALGYGSVTSMEQFRALVESLDLTTAEGAQTYASLMSIAGAFAEVHNSTKALEDQKAILEQLAKLYQLTGDEVGAAAVLEQQHQLALKDMSAALADVTKQVWAAEAAEKARQETLDTLNILAQINDALGNSAGKAAVQLAIQKAQLDAMTPAMAALTRELYIAQASSGVASAYQNLVTQTQSVISSLNQFITSMEELQNTLKTGELSTLSPEQKLAAAKSNYESILARAQAGDETARGQLSSAAQSYLTADRAYNASNPTYAADAQKVQNDISKLVAGARTQVSAQEQMLENAKAQLAALGVQTTVQATGFAAIAEALDKLAAAIGVLKAAQTTPASATQSASEAAINSLYQTILGRDGEKAGMDFWVNALKSGVSLERITQDFYNSPEYLANHKHAAGGMATGWSLVGEKGPEVVNFSHPAQVYPTSQTAGMFAAKTPNLDPRVVALLEDLVREARASNVQRAAVHDRNEELMAEQTATLEKTARAHRAAASQAVKGKS